MVTVHLLRGKQGDALRLTLSGKALITGEGADRLVQSFPSAAAAKEHLDRVLALRQRDGYTLVEVRETTEEEEDARVDPLAGCVAWDAARGRMTVTFKGPKVPPGRCAEVVARVEKEAPSSLQLICDPASPGPAFAKALAGKALPSLRAFIFDTHSQTVARQRENACGDLADVLAACPSLARVFMTGKVALRPARHEALRELVLIGDPLAPRVLAGLGESAFPALELLAIRLYSDAAPEPESAVAEALRGLDAPNLRVVHVDGLERTADFLDALTSTPLPPSWSTLSIGSRMDEEDELLEALERCVPALGSLEALGLPLSDDLSVDAEEAARRLLASVVDRGELPNLFVPHTYEAW